MIILEVYNVIVSCSKKFLLPFCILIASLCLKIPSFF